MSASVAPHIPEKKGPCLVTGAAGFIGFHLARRLLREGWEVVGVDNLNDYYDVRLKRARVAELEGEPRFHFLKIDLADRNATEGLFRAHSFPIVLHMAAQAGVRYSLTHPHAYLDSNLAGFLGVLEGCRQTGVGHLILASSSSVYGSNTKVPFSEDDRVDLPANLYGATKRSGELMARAYSLLYRLPCTGLRFFTVYGPWGRPDMAYFLFTKAISEGQPCELFDGGRMQRDFTYIDDVVDGVLQVLKHPPQGEVPFEIYNVGNNHPVSVSYLIEVLEKLLGRQAEKRARPAQPGEIALTHADSGRLAALGFRPNTPIEEGLQKFVAWYRDYYTNPKTTF